MTERILIGCSGWQYKHWRGSWYPQAMAQKDWFAFYAERFGTVEVNNSFYRWPPPTTFAAWRAKAPRGFRWVIKGPRYITHLKRLLDPEATLPPVFAGLSELGRTLAGVLWQLPPHEPYRPGRLEAFLEHLPRTGTHAFEFRHPSWYVEAVYAALDRHRCGIVVHDHRSGRSPERCVGGCVYLRLHGWHADNGSYPDDELARWADWLLARSVDAKLACAFFNNDLFTAAPRNAVTLRTALTERAAGAVAVF